DYEFVFPMVVGPRYIPGTPIEENAVGGGTAIAPLTRNQDTDLVPDAFRLNAPILPAGVRSGHDIGVTVEIDAVIQIQKVTSPSHQIQVDHEGQKVRVQLAGADTIPNKDLILRYQVAGSNTRTTLLTQTDDRGGHFALYLIPAVQYRPDQLVPKDVVFLIDTSGSQHGAPLRQCQELMRRFINGLNPNDTFTIIDFSDTTRQLSPVPLLNTAQNRARAIQYINQLNAGGGTEMLRGMRAVLNFPIVEPGRLRSIVLLTDGYIGNENQILAEVQRRLQPGNRLYSFGAGSSVNRFLLNRIAEIGRGVSRIVRQDEPTEEVAEKFFRQINNPVLTNLNLRWEGAGAPPVIHPATPPDLFAEQPLVLFGRKLDQVAGKLHVTGITAGGQRYQQTFDLQFDAAGNPAIAQRWGRAQIKDLMNQMVSGDTKAGVEAVTHTALTYQLLSQYTAFVAVSDEAQVNPQQHSVSIQVPVEMPEGVNHIGVFGHAVAGEALPEVIAGLPRFQPAAPSVSAPTAERRSLSAESADQATTKSIASRQNGQWRVHRRSDEVGGDSDDHTLDTMSGSPGATRSPESEQIGGIPLLEIGGKRLQVISAPGLAQADIEHLTQHFQLLPLPPGFNGDLVFEFQVTKGRIRQLVLDGQASSLQEGTVIEAIRRSLLCWRPNSSIAATVRLTLRIQP
ncbi:MAG: after-VIT domain-containing protein, partial [Kovacikia sp.]